IAGERIRDAVRAEIVAAVRNDRAVGNHATGHAVRGRDRITRAAAGDRVIRAAVVVDLDELVVGAAGATNAELADDHLTEGGRNDRYAAQREYREGERHANLVVDGSRIYLLHAVISYSPFTLRGSLNSVENAMREPCSIDAHTC